MQLVKRDYKLTAIEIHLIPFKICFKVLLEYRCTLCVTLMKYNYQISERQLPNHHNNRKTQLPNLSENLLHQKSSKIYIIDHQNLTQN